MIEVRTPLDITFEYNKCKNLYNKCKDSIGDDSFEEVINRTYFYAFHIKENDELIGCIYFFNKGHKVPKLYMNGFANRKHHRLNLECIKESLKWWNCPIYSYSENKAAKLCLLRTNFEKIKENVYIYRR